MVRVIGGLSAKVWQGFNRVEVVSRGTVSDFLGRRGEARGFRPHRSPVVGFV